MGGGISNSSEQSQSEVVWSNLLDLHSGKLSPIERLILVMVRGNSGPQKLQRGCCQPRSPELALLSTVALGWGGDTKGSARPHGAGKAGVGGSWVQPAGRKGVMEARCFLKSTKQKGLAREPKPPSEACQPGPSPSTVRAQSPGPVLWHRLCHQRVPS